MNIKRSFQRLGLLTVFCMASTASADTLRYAGGAAASGFGGPGVGPYLIEINGATAVQGICDDFVHFIPGGPWTAIKNTFSAVGLSGGRFLGQANGLSKYFQVAWLSERLLGAITNNQRALYQYAIWDTFNPAIGGLSDANKNAVLDLKQQAADATRSSNGADFANWSVYTPTGTPDSQEFFVRTPETSAATVLAFNLSALVGVIFILRRRITGI